MFIVLQDNPTNEDNPKIEDKLKMKMIIFVCVWSYPSQSYNLQPWYICVFVLFMGFPKHLIKDKSCLKGIFWKSIFISVFKQSWIKLLLLSGGTASNHVTSIGIVCNHMTSIVIMLLFFSIFTKQITSIVFNVTMWLEL